TPTPDAASLRRHPPLAPADRTRPVHSEPALPERNHPTPPALRTGGQGGPRRRAAAAARGAHFCHRQRHRHLASQGRHPERDRHGGLDLVLVVRASAALGATPAEDAREQVPQPAERAETREIEADPGASPPGASPAPPPPGPIVRAVAAQPVVALALLGIAQDVLRLVDFLEAVRRLGVAGIAIGMVLLSEPTKRLLDFVHRRRLRDPEDLVIVLRRGHQPLSPRGRGSPAPPSCG